MVMHENINQVIRTVRHYLPDLWSTAAHSTSFQNTRSGYLRSRITLLSVVWGLLIILWIPLDLIFLSDIQAQPIAIARFMLGCGLLLTAWHSHHHTKLYQSQWSLIVLVIMINAFYIYCISVLDFPQAYSGAEYGYTLLPIIHVAILTILPLTLKESLGLLAITALCQIGVDVKAQRLFTPEVMAGYWLQNVLALMVIWSQQSKLYMLMRLYRQATLDPLTGIYNRRMLLQLAQKSLEACEQNQQTFSVLLFDIDKFKRVNDTWGHGAGDDVLKRFTHFIQSQIRKTDLFGRYGGEEFILFLPNCDHQAAQDIANRMLDSIRSLNLDINAVSTQLRITSSVGISSLSHGDSLSSLIERADRALYECKDAGRDCARFHPLGYIYSQNERRKAVA
ncbi:GGDEF domain-containing protein [Photobacterium sanguinicancri]|uniref:GGDEF domain-containing protein n=1 Tax=Photobacterium sanguinicancri TaxID=875932 RepID=UPI0026E1E081|nr:GGDEF domain-containing protein [Photobacterium sanguinicancri]MDO6498583.1 GGDEF domain-containing protein [Photobacterium sanguinicancri]